MFKTTNALAAVAAAALCTVGLFAAPTAFAKTMEVSYRDLDLSTVSGQKKLDQRINSAARRVCDFDQANTGSRIRDNDAVDCYRKAVSQVRSQVAAAIDDASDGNRLGG